MADLSYEERMKWFHEARFGLFIHWGLYSVLGRGEWVMFNERIPKAHYARLADQFNPRRFDADAWAALAVEAGMKYAVLTTRHHDGFCLFDSEVSDFTAPKGAARRDFVAEYVQAFRRAGLKVGFYYSLLDWRFPGYWAPDKEKASAEAMVEQAHAQVRELMTNYGKIDVLWYDGGWLPREVRKDVAKFWRAQELNRAVREYQPHILINNRSGLEEDLDTPEQHVTASRAGRGWESCMTIGDSCGWGFIRNNPNLKTLTQLLQNLVIAAAGEGNYLLNVGPQPDGTVRKEEQTRLRDMGRWLQANGEAIYGSQRCALHGGMVGLWTRKRNLGYLHIFRWPGYDAAIPLVKTRVRRAWVLATGEEVRFRQEHNGRLILEALPAYPPDSDVSVLKVEFEGEPEALKEKDRAAWLAGKAR
ncbi:MAG: alpha-L-fucosidase [Candidatus Hydrogenedentes bacterium]|nr:alpha-L-fucosidase [Candidatus Hydrogenedentota bacterium]